MNKALLSALLAVLVVLSLTVGCVSVVRTPPPPPRVEVRPAPPFPEAVWLPGHWQRDRVGEWIWVPGHWEKAPKPGAVWVPGHWVETPGGWKWVPGHWQR